MYFLSPLSVITCLQKLNKYECVTSFPLQCPGVHVLLEGGGLKLLGALAVHREGEHTSIWVGEQGSQRG